MFEFSDDTPVLSEAERLQINIDLYKNLLKERASIERLVMQFPHCQPKLTEHDKMLAAVRAFLIRNRKLSEADVQAIENDVARTHEARLI